MCPKQLKGYILKDISVSSIEMSAQQSDHIKCQLLLKTKQTPYIPWSSATQCSRTCNDQARVTREIKALKLFPSEEQLNSLGHLVLAKR